MTFSLCYTSIRAKFIPEVVKAWVTRAKNPASIEILIAVDHGDESCLKAAIGVAMSLKDMVVVEVLVQKEKPKTCVLGWNLAASYSKNDVLIAIADDFVPPPGWDEKLANVGEDGWHLKDHVVKVFDGYNPDLCTLPIVTRARFARMGYLFYPGYLSLFSDTEFTQVALNDGVVIDAMNLLFEHHHPDCGKRARDSHDDIHASSFRWNIGENLFNYRKESGFQVDLGPMADSKRPRPQFNSDFDKFAVYVQAIKDDFCLYEVCRRMAEEGLRRFYFFVPLNYWSGSVASIDDFNQVKDISDRLKSIGCDAKCITMEVFFDGKTRLDAETNFRNRSLDHMWADGVEHVLIVDGDELWHKGLFNSLLSYIGKPDVDAIQCPMVPVVGLPGYPVDGATDKAVVYIKKGVHFAVCRTPEKEAMLLSIRGVIHFTATRKTREEIIEKMRDSGHYDDPDYDFEGWIQRKLPNIRPGMRNVHMYKPWQIWPSVREWRHDEIEHIPPSIRPFLGLPLKHAKVKKVKLADQAKLLQRPPCQDPSTSAYRIGVFVGNRR